MKQNIIFLDFDGVIVVAASHYGEADEGCVACLNEIIERTEASVVISSTWRIGRSIKDLEKLVIGWGIKGRIAGMTPILARAIGSLVIAGPRGKEIATWLKENRTLYKNFVILDDDADMHPLLHKLVQTKFDTGLQPKHISLALARLLVP